jgi:hypothetical protein
MLTPKAHRIAIHFAFALLVVGLLFVTSVAPHTIRMDHDRHAATNEESEKQLIDRRIANYTLALALFTGVLAVSTIGLWTITDLTLRHSRETAERQLRAWVGPVTTNCDVFAAGHRIQAKIVIINTGKSPAQNMRVAVRGHILDTGILPPIPGTSAEPPKTLFPSIPDEHPAFHNVKLSLQDQEGIDKGQRTAWIIARIDYFVGKNDPRYTNICTRWDRSRRVFVPH